MGFLLHESSIPMVLQLGFRLMQDYVFSLFFFLKLGQGLTYEAAEGTYFPHFYGPDRTFQPLSLDAVSKADKLEVRNGEFTCRMLDHAGSI